MFRACSDKQDVQTESEEGGRAMSMLDDVAVGAIGGLAATVGMAGFMTLG